MVSSSVGIFQRVLQMGGTLITMPLVLHALGSKGFGIWAAAASLAWMTAMVDFGIGNALLTVVARTAATDEYDETRRQVAGALCISILLGVIEVLFAIVAIPLIAPPAAIGAYRIAAIFLALNIPASLSAPIWSGLQRLYMVWAWEAAQTVLTLGGLFALTRFTTHPLAYVAVTAGGLLAANCGSLCHLFLTHPEVRPSWLLSVSRRLTRELLKKGAPYLVLGLSLTLAVYSDNMIALSMLGADEAARMAVAQRACMTAMSILLVLTQPLWPAFTDAIARGDYAWLRHHVLSASVVVTACAVAGSAVLVAAGRPLLSLWLGGGLTISQGVLWAMAAWIVVPALGRIPDVLLNALGVVWFQVGVALIYSILAFVLKINLAPSLGVAGILVSTGIAYGLTHLPAYVWWVARWMRKCRDATIGEQIILPARP